MDTTIITAISNTATEYRAYTEKLSDTLEYCMYISNTVGAGDENLSRCIDVMSQHIQELRAVARAMDDITVNYRTLHQSIESAVYDTENRTGDIEFGISEFGNLSKHEKLMPIHR